MIIYKTAPNLNRKGINRTVSHSIDLQGIVKCS